MYSNKEHVNILTALLVKHHVSRAVVCPGSRNAPIVHNLNACPDIECYGVTDERSAGFFALGLALNEGQPSPVAVCVTSGTALLNLLPAVAEAWYQHVPLVVISADRPAQWIDQLDGQTLPQADALGRFVRKAVDLQEPTDDETRWYANRLVNEALLAMNYPTPAPVHINVPIAEPLFAFTTQALPDERMMEMCFAKDCSQEVGDRLVSAFSHAHKPMIVIGQTHSDFIHNAQYANMMEQLGQRAVVLTERLCNYSTQTVCFEEVLAAIGHDERYQPDLVVNVGGTLVGKRLKRFLRAGGASVVRLTESSEPVDTFMHLSEILVCPPEKALEHLLVHTRQNTDNRFISLWKEALQAAAHHAQTYQPGHFSSLHVIKKFEESLARMPYIYKVHYANSTAVRLANIFAHHPVFCNRGVNGIEGSLSTASGMSAKTDDRVFCVIGDLSFFYDQNALWNQNLRGNLRILLLNNGGGGIFRQLKGLEQSPARNQYVAGGHHTNAEGICQQSLTDYRQACNSEELSAGLDWLMADGKRPKLLEVVTDADTDAHELSTYYQGIKTS